MDFRAYLEYFGWTQREFAERINVTEETVSRWKNSPPTLVSLYLEERKGHIDFVKENIEFNKETVTRLERFVL